MSKALDKRGSSGHAPSLKLTLDLRGHSRRWLAIAAGRRKPRKSSAEEPALLASAALAAEGRSSRRIDLCGGGRRLRCGLLRLLAAARGLWTKAGSSRGEGRLLLLDALLRRVGVPFNFFLGRGLLGWPFGRSDVSLNGNWRDRRLLLRKRRFLVRSRFGVSMGASGRAWEKPVPA